VYLFGAFRGQAQALSFDRELLYVADRHDTTFGNVKADVLERYVPGFRRGNFVDVILQSEWPE
jgi:hypothetical protein